MTTGRDEQGRFVKGEWPGGPGRPAKHYEEKYRIAFSEVVTPEKFKASCQQVWMDSVGKKIDLRGKLVEDADSTPASRVSAFSRLASYALGKPIQPVLIDSADGGLLAVFRDMSDENLNDIIDEAKRILASSEPKSE